MTPSDKAGREITIGAYIVYGHALGRCAGLQFGRVLNIKHTGEGKQNPWDDSPWRITVIGVDDHGYGWQKEPELNRRKGTLMFPERIIVLDTLPEKVKTLLDGYIP